MAHEDLTREQHVEGSSDRSFGLVFSGVFFVVALWPLVRGLPPRWWALAIAAPFGLITLFKPALFSGMNRLWTALGVRLAKIVGPIALLILFYGVLTPVGMLMRLTGKDPLRLDRDS